MFTHANTGCSLEAAAGTSDHGRAPRESAVSMAQWASMWHEPTPTSAARVRRKRACCVTSRERVSAVARLRVRTCECRLLIGGGCWPVKA